MLDLDMSPYAAFVWPAWAITAVVLAGLVVRAVTASRRWQSELKRLDAEARADRPQVAQGAIGPESRPQAAQGAIGPDNGPQAAQSAIGQQE